MVVAAERQRRAVAARAGHIGVAEDVAGAVDARPFAVPDADHAVVLRLAQHVMDLAAQHRGGGDIFVHAGHEMDAMLLEQRGYARQGEVVSAERRSLVAGDKCGGVEIGQPVAPHLVHGQTHQGLHPGEVDGTGLLRVFVVKLHLVGRRRARRLMIS